MMVCKCTEDDPAYKLRIFVNSAEQMQVAQQSLQSESLRLNSTIFAEVLNASDYTFWKATEMHQQFDYKEGLRCGQSTHQSQRLSRSAKQRRGVAVETMLV